jgi:hypothetical protein
MSADPKDRDESSLARRLEGDSAWVDDDPTSGEYYEAVSLVYRTLQCVDHCKRAIAHAERAGDYELSLLLEDVLCDANLRARLVREALASRAATAAPTSAMPKSDIRDLAPRTTRSISGPPSSAQTPWEAMPDAEGAPAAVVVQGEGRWFVLPSGRRADCGDRKVIRRLLVRLARQRQHAPGMPVSVEELLRVGWPEEPLVTDTGRNRLRVSIVRLRRLGLHELLRSHQGGYLIDPAVVVRIVGDDPWR